LLFVPQTPAVPVITLTVVAAKLVAIALLTEIGYGSEVIVTVPITAGKANNLLGDCIILRLVDADSTVRVGELKVNPNGS